MVVRSPGFRPQGPLGALLGWLFLGRSRYPERRRTVKNSSLLDNARAGRVRRGLRASGLEGGTARIVLPGRSGLSDSLAGHRFLLGAARDPHDTAAWK